jgi:hypothetical protein
VTKMKRFCLYKMLAFVNDHVSGNSATGRLVAICLFSPCFCPQCTTPPPHKHPILLCFADTGSSRAACVKPALMFVLLCVLCSSEYEQASAVFVVLSVV